VPPKYISADFLRHSYSSRRGMLDMPRSASSPYPAPRLVGPIRSRVGSGG
jgi:hypothetical protein